MSGNPGALLQRVDSLLGSLCHMHDELTTLPRSFCVLNP